ncbi:MAG: TauD/TfdA family dioxygenase [Actinomycetota bacterium]|nr:TauD/TfdA family dioxygenase [Actinomycetota bacterium]
MSTTTTETVMQPLGVRVTDIDLAAVTSADVSRLRSLLARHGVVVLPDQQVDDTAFVQFLTSFGELVPPIGETPVDGFPDLNVISNVGRTTPPRSTFHVDTSYVSCPPAYTALRAVLIPAAGGETLFSNQFRACDTLPLQLRERVEGRTIEHVVTGVELGPDDESAAHHPVLRPHPLSGRTALYLTTASRCAGVSGIDDPEARELVDALIAHSTRPDNVYRHAWSPGDVVMWDNGCVLHRADHAGVVGDRVMHRGMVAGYGPDAATLAS